MMITLQTFTSFLWSLGIASDATIMTLLVGLRDYKKYPGDNYLPCLTNLSMCWFRYVLSI